MAKNAGKKSNFIFFEIGGIKKVYACRFFFFLKRRKIKYINE